MTSVHLFVYNVKYMPKIIKEHKCSKCATTDPTKFYPLHKSLCKQCRSVKGLTPHKPHKQHKCKECLDTNPDNFLPSAKSLCKVCINKKTQEKYQFYKSKYNYTGTMEDFILRQERSGKYGKEYSKIWQRQNIFKFRVSSAKHRAKRNNLEFDLTEEFIKGLWETQAGNCYYSGIPMSIETTGRHSLSLDKKDSSKGYTQDNVVLCSWAVNTMKNDLTVEEFKIIISSIYHNIP